MKSLEAFLDGPLVLVARPRLQFYFHLGRAAYLATAFRAAAYLQVFRCKEEKNKLIHICDPDGRIGVSAIIARCANYKLAERTASIIEDRQGLVRVGLIRRKRKGELRGSEIHHFRVSHRSRV